MAEDLADDVSYDPSSGNWWINVRAANAGTGAYITPLNFDVTQTNWQLTIKDAAGAVVFGPAGEGINPVSDIGPPEAGQAEWWRSWPSSTTTRPPAITVRTRGTPKR